MICGVNSKLSFTTIGRTDLLLLIITKIFTFAYHTYSKYKPKPHHFEILDPEMILRRIVNYLSNFIVALEKMK